MSKPSHKLVRLDVARRRARSHPGRHRQESPSSWERIAANASYVATVASLIVSLVMPAPGTLASMIEDRKQHAAAAPAVIAVHSKVQHPDGTPYSTPECRDAIVVPKNVIRLFDDEHVVVATLQAQVSAFCGLVFPQLVHVMKAPWHGMVTFTVRRSGIPHRQEMGNLYDPLTADGVAVPDAGCVDVSAYISRTDFEATPEVTLPCVGLADVT